MKKLIIEELRTLVGRSEPCVTIYLNLTGQRDADKNRLQETAMGAFMEARRVFPEYENVFTGTITDQLIPECFGLDDRNTPQKTIFGTVAIFKSPTISGFIPLSGHIEDLVVIAESFHLKPLFTFMQMDTRYSIVIAEEHQVTLAKGESDKLQKVKTFTNKSSAPSRQGRDIKSKREILRFYRDLDLKIRRQWLDHDLPIILVGDSQLTKLFMSANKYRTPFLRVMEIGGIDSLDYAELHKVALDLILSANRRNALKTVFEYKFARRFGRAADSLAQVARAAAEGDVKSLLVRQGVNLWGSVNRDSGTFNLMSRRDSSKVDDIIDDIGEMVIKRGGEVHLLSADEMPTNSPVAAVLTSLSA